MLYVVAEERLGKASTVLTSNRPPRDWYAIFPDPVVGGAVLDRMVSSAIKLISTTGSSYRKEVMGNPTRSSAKTRVDDPSRASTPFRHGRGNLPDPWGWGMW